MVKHSQSSQNSKFAMSSQYLKKKLEIKSIFCMQINIKLSQKLISTFWASWFSQGILLLLMGTFKHSQRTQSNKFAISLQYLKKKVRNRVHILHADKHQSFCKLGILFLVEVARHVQSTQNRKLVILLQYLRKNNIDEVYFLYANKHEQLPQCNTNILDVFGQT